jgi:hypothetical protein
MSYCELPSWLISGIELKSDDKIKFIKRWICKHSEQPPEWVGSISDLPKEARMKLMEAWIIKHQEQPPEWIGSISELSETDIKQLAGEWFVTHNEQPPKWLGGAIELSEDHRRTAMYDWIHKKSQYQISLRAEFPLEAFYNEISNDERVGYIVEWVRSVKTIPPDWLLGSAILTDAQKQYILMTVVGAEMTHHKYGRGTPVIPDWLKHDPTTQDHNGDTTAMWWIKRFEAEPLEWMRHGSNLKNKLGLTLLDYWLAYMCD